MASPTSSAEVQTLITQVRRLEQRVRELEGASRMTGSIPRGRQLYVVDSNGNPTAVIGGPNGGTVFYDSDGDPVAQFGTYIDGNFVSRDGLVLYAKDVRALEHNSDRGLTYPYEHVHLHSMDAPMEVSSGTYTDTVRGRVELMQTDTVKIYFEINVPASNGAEVRASIAGGGTTSGHSVGAGFHGVTCIWKHGLTLGSGPYYFVIQVRRSSGADTLHVWPGGVTSGDFGNIGTGTGLWSTL